MEAAVVVFKKTMIRLMAMGRESKIYRRLKKSYIDIRRMITGGRRENLLKRRGN